MGTDDLDCPTCSALSTTAGILKRLLPEEKYGETRRRGLATAKLLIMLDTGAAMIIAKVVAANLMVLAAVILLLAAFAPGFPIALVYSYSAALAIVCTFLGAIFWRQ